MIDEQPKQEQPKQEQSKLILPDIPTSWERYTVLIVFSSLTLYMAYVGNREAMVMAAANLSTYFLSRQGA